MAKDDDVKIIRRDEYENPKKNKGTAPTGEDDRNWLKKAGDAIDSVFMPVANKIDTLTAGAQYGAAGELAPYLAAIPRGKMPETIRNERDTLRKENPGTFKAGDMAGTVARDVGIGLATGGASAPLSWAGTLGRGAVGGLTTGVLNETTKFMPEAYLAGEDYDVGQGLLRVGVDTGFGTAAAAGGRALASKFSGRGHIANAAPMLSDAEMDAARRGLQTAADPRYGLQGAGKLNAAEAARFGAPEAPGLAEAGAGLETLVQRAGSKASDKMVGPTRAAALAREQPGGFLDQAARAKAQKEAAEAVTDATMGTTPVPGARGPNFTPERQMFTQAARVVDPAIPAQAYPIVKETIGKSLFPGEAARATAAVGRASPEAAREQSLTELIRNFDKFKGAMKGPVSNEAVASGAPVFKDMAKSASSFGAGAAGVGTAASKFTNPGYATAARLIHDAPEETLRQVGRGTQGMDIGTGSILGLLDALAQAKLRPDRG
jgi:hypothetical protein